MVGFRDTLNYRLVRLARTTSEEYAARLGRLGLRPLHVSLLTAVADRQRAPQNEHAAELGVTPGFVVRLADELERLGAVTRERDSEDRRRQYLILTSKGRSLLRKATRVATGLDEELTRGLSPDASTRLTESLAKIESSLAGT